MLDDPPSEVDGEQPLAAEEAEPPVSAVRAAIGEPATEASNVSRPDPTVKVRGSGTRRFFELDGVRYECRPAKPARTAKPRGLAAVSPDRRAEISRKGGEATARSPNAVRFQPGEAAREAGRKGGLARARNARDLSLAAE